MATITPGEVQGVSGEADDVERPGLHLADALQTLDLWAELFRLRDEETWLRAGRHARTLVKDADLRVVLVTLRAGMRMEDHHAPGRLTIQTLTGWIVLQTGERSIDLPAGRLLTLGPAIAHTIEAREETAFLLTIAWPNAASATPL
jgi:quercetin dioxygenase-like cupin family protein